MKKIAIYSRVSTKDQSLVQQLEVLRKYCTEAGYEIVHEYIDEGVSAFKKNRPGYLQMLEDARLRKFNLLLVYKLDRFGRSLKELINAMDLLKSYGIGFISYTQKEFDTTTASGELMFHIVGSFANFERSLISERTRLKLHYLRSQGMILGRPRKVDSKRLLELRAQGLSLNQIAKELNCDRTTVSKNLKICNGRLN